MFFHQKPSDFIAFRPTFAFLYPKTRLPFLYNELFRSTHLYNICMGFGGGFQSFFWEIFWAQESAPTEHAELTLMIDLEQTSGEGVSKLPI